MLKGPKYEEIGEMTIRRIDCDQYINEICECLENAGYSTALIAEGTLDTRIRILLKMEED